MPGASPNYMVTKPVTIKAMLRVCADLAREDAEPADGRVKRWETAPRSRGPSRCAPSASEGFYERFPAKGQVERVARIHRELGRYADIQSAKKRGSKTGTDDYARLPQSAAWWLLFDLRDIDRDAEIVSSTAAQRSPRAPASRR